MTVREYNKEFLPKIQRAREFINLFESAVRHMDEKTVNKDEVMKQFELRCWSEETKETILTALEYYKQKEGLDPIYENLRKELGGDNNMKIDMGNKVNIAATVVDYNEGYNKVKVKIDGFAEDKSSEAERYVWVNYGDIQKN